MMKLLTISIPTHNRCECLKRSLEILLPQVLMYKDDVDLLISDNNSSDNTENYVKQFLEKFPNSFRYNKNQKDEGYLYNFNIGVHLANSKYVYLLGDDDIVPQGFVGTIIEILNSHEDIGLLHFNYMQFSNRLRRLKVFYKDKCFGQIEKQYSFSDFLREFWDGPTFMSSLVFKRSIWIEGESQFEENCYGYDWLMKIFAGCNNCQCLYYNMPLMIQIDSNINPYNEKWALYSIVGKSRIFENLNKNYNGLYDEWKVYHRKRFVESIDVLSATYDKRTYRGNKELCNYIDSKYNRFLLYMTLTVLPTFLVRKILIPCFKIISYIS